MCKARCSSREHCIPDRRRSSTSDAQLAKHELALTDAMHQFDAG